MTTLIVGLTVIGLFALAYYLDGHPAVQQRRRLRRLMKQEQAAHRELDEVFDRTRQQIRREARRR